MKRFIAFLAVTAVAASALAADSAAQLELEATLFQLTVPMNPSVARRMLKAVPQVTRNADGGVVGIEVDGAAIAGSGTITATAGALTLNGVVLGAGTTDTKVAAGITTNGTSRITLGVAGTSVGGLDFKNATSGTLSIQPPTGALGTVTLTLPAATDTLVGKATTDTLTNKTLTAPTINGGTATALTGLAVLNAGTGAFDLTIAHNGTLTAGRTLTLNLNDAARTVSLAGNVTLAGALVTSGANSLTLTTTGATNVTLPTSGTLATTTQALAESICVAASDETTALTTGTAKVTFRMPFAMTGVTVRGSLATAQTSGSILTVDINEGGTTILSTKLTIDNAERTSTTAATAAVVSDASLADDAEITIDIDQVGDGTAKGLKVCLSGSR
jgi:hypothetical protein